MRFTTLLPLALLALATSSAPIRTLDDDDEDQSYPSHLIFDAPPTLDISVEYAPHTSIPLTESSSDEHHEDPDIPHPVLAARAPPKTTLSAKTTTSTPQKKKKPPTTTAKLPASARPSSLVKIINSFDTAHTLNTGATSKSTSALDGPAMDRSGIPLDLVLVQGSISLKLNPQLLKTHSASLAADVQTVVDGAVCAADEIQGGGAGGENTVQHALLCVGIVVSKILKAILRPAIKPQWDVVGLGPAPQTDIRMAIDGEAYTVIECKTLASLPATTVDWVMDNLPNFKVVTWPEQPGGVRKYRTLIDSSQAALHKTTRTERSKLILPLEQTLAQMFYYDTTTAALTNFEDWILFHRPSDTSTTVTVMRTTNVKLYNRKTRSSILDIMLALVLGGLRGKKKLKSLLAQ